MTAPDTIFGYGWEWAFVLAPLMALGTAWLGLRWAGKRAPVEGRRRSKAALGLEQVTGLPAWSSAPLVVGGFGLVIAAIGFLWDVAWHIDLGRDELLFTPAHTAILTGLGLLGLAAVMSVVYATEARADVRAFGPLRVPDGALALGVLAAGAMAGFPLDELWHRAYGVDVTMWGPTHLLMIGGASLSPLAFWLLLAEPGPAAGRPWYVRSTRIALAGALVTGLSTFQAEFDFGVPQFQQLYHPVLIALATGLGLALCRSALGPGGAVAGAAGFIAMRGVLAAVVSPVLGHVAPRFPLYLGAAVAVEAAFALGRRYGWRPLRTAVAAGIGVATVGLAAEWGWTHVWGRHPWGTELFPAVLVAALAAVAAAVLGTAAGRIVSWRRTGVPAAALAVAGAAVLGSLVVPFPRSDEPVVSAVVVTEPAEPGTVWVEAEVRPHDAAVGADWFEVLAWQGGGMVTGRMLPTGEPGVYRTSEPVPVTGGWKATLRLATHDRLLSLPVRMPADPAIGASAVPVEARKTEAFQRDADVLMREAHDGPAWPAIVAYSAILAIAVAWLSGLVRGFVRRAGANRNGRLRGRRVVVTGGAGAIGAATIAALVHEGASVVPLDVTDAPGVVVADLRDPAATRAAMDEAARRLGGGVDVLVNNAGIGDAVDAASAPDATVREVLDVNLLGAWNATAAAMPYLAAARGHVVNVSSGLAWANVPWAAAYAASKRGMAAWSDALRMEHAGTRLAQVTTVYPGYIRTPIHDRAAANGVSLEGLVPAVPLEHAVEALVDAVVHRPREATTGGPSGLGIRFARHFPRVADAVVRLRFLRARDGQPAPGFVRRFDATGSTVVLPEHDGERPGARTDQLV